MSKLTEKLRKVGKSEPGPIGFGLFAPRAKTPQLLLLAELPPAHDADAARQALADGADALLLGPTADLDRVKGVLAAAGEAPVGGGLEGHGVEVARALHEAGGDFLVLTSLDTPVAVLQLDGPAKLLEVDPDWGDTVLRAVEGLPLDAVLLRVAGPCTLATWLTCLRVAGLTRRALLVALPGPVDGDALTSLRDAGASAVVVEPAAVAAARRLIDTLPSPKRRREHAEALLPAAPQRTPAPSEEEDDD
ncbi:MAG: hypothetical protein HY689_00150 [Chloroflexi bacterium]|nr:hypothetical protein [Chloroflexota bacterium]